MELTIGANTGLANVGATYPPLVEVSASHSTGSIQEGGVGKGHQGASAGRGGAFDFCGLHSDLVVLKMEFCCKEQ